MSDGSIDVHQHLWPPALLDALRRRSRPPRLDGWTLHTAGEPPYLVQAGDHDSALRTRLEHDRAQVLLSLSTPLGIEELPPQEAHPLIETWHQGVAALGAPFAGWAAVGRHEPDLAVLRARLSGPSAMVGLQISAAWLATPSALEQVAPVLEICQQLNRPVLVHPGPVPERGQPSPALPDWWAGVVDYPAQLQAAWWSWWTVGRSLLPTLRICFVAGAGLAPVQHERFVARSGQRFALDPWVFVETSSYRRQGVDALVRALGIDTVVLGSDRPYAEPLDPQLGEAGWQAIARRNPVRLLSGIVEEHFSNAELYTEIGRESP